MAVHHNDLKSHLQLIRWVIERKSHCSDTERLSSRIRRRTQPVPESDSESEILNQAFELGYTYTRSTGPVVGRFLTGLRERQVVGNRGSDGRVIVPPMEYDPGTAEALSEFVDVSEEGEVVSWAWVKHPREAHPSDQPFAWAMIRLDGADVPMVHWVQANREADINTGSRVRVRWAEETTGSINDIAGFELV
ncbi:DNA-binding protein [Pseudohalioglobus lutimaris]|uniref:DNA-binding protein n=1 Tax=Pseudohalioglobus lutimaris TaxID=1737061 RepID=A0A2N5X360_9GAMM|nr:DNA-binding protein [Pseudohalioglobus lutimaris]